MKERLARLYSEGRISTEGISNAVTRGWITQDDAEEILKVEKETTEKEIE